MKNDEENKEDLIQSNGLGEAYNTKENENNKDGEKEEDKKQKKAIETIDINEMNDKKCLSNSDDLNEANSKEKCFKNNEIENSEDKLLNDKSLEKKQKEKDKREKNVSEENSENPKDVTEVKKNKTKKMANHEQTKEKNKTVIITFIVIIVLILLIGIFCTIFSFLNINNEKIMNNITINGIDVSDLTIDEAREVLNKVINAKKEEIISLVYDIEDEEFNDEMDFNNIDDETVSEALSDKQTLNKDYETNIDLKQIEVEYQIEDALIEAYKVGRNGNIIQNNFEILNSYFTKKEIDIVYSYNVDILKTAIDTVSANLPGKVIQSSYYIEEENLIITSGKEGIVADEEKLTKMIEEVIDTFEIKDEILDIPVVIKNPDPVDIEKIRNEIYKEPKDAYFTTNPYNIYTHIDGVDLGMEIEQIQELLKEDKEEYEIPLKITQPEVTINDLGEEAFPELISTFKTKYDAGNKNRTTNLRLAANKIDGVVLMPGEVFSYNKVVGERTIEAGYKEAKIFSNGQVVDGLGGGICQISSTLYNTALLANLEITTRRNHQFTTSYVDPGRDATVVYGSQDFEFKNTRNYPIKIKVSVNGGIAKIDIYGILEETEYEVVIETKKVQTIAYTTKYIDDASLDEGTEVVVQKGANGSKVEAYKVLKLNGQIVSRTLLSKDTYNPMQKIVRRGTKKIETQSEPIQNAS